MSAMLAMAAGPVAQTIDLPYCEETVSTNTILRSIERSDTATVIHYTFVHQPGYWCSLDDMELVGNNTGKVYRIRRVDGYQPGEKKYMPRSGRFDFTITFPAIDSADTAVDMIEVESDGARYAVRKGVDITGAPPVCSYATHITGTYEGTAGYVGLRKAGPERNAKTILIPVDDGKFDYTLASDELLAYDIINGPNLFIGSWSARTIFSENADISVDFKLGENSGGEDGIQFHDISVYPPARSLTADLMHIRNVVNHEAPAISHVRSLKQERKYYVPEYYEFEARAKRHPEQSDSLVAELFSRYTEQTVMTAEGAKADSAARHYMINERPRVLCDLAVKMDNLAGLYAIVHEAYFSEDTAPLVEAYLKGYEGRYPESEYAIYMNKLAGTSEIAPGLPFNDFSAVDFEGNSHTLSTLIKGKPALLDLWASWCGPCRRTSMSMIPVYEKYADKGFTIVGVAREYTDSKAAAEAIAKDGYKWLNLIEIDDSNGIWALYRRHNAAGGTFLISPDGKIVKTDVTADEVRDYLKSLYESE